MILFYNDAAKHLARKISLKRAKFFIKAFSDGEIYVRISENVKNRNVWVLASTIAPGENLLELLFLLDALKRERAKIHLLIVYLAYARQDKRKKGESLSAQVICEFLRPARDITVLHAHSPRLRRFLNFKNIVPLEIYGEICKKFDVLAAPDKGSIGLVNSISRMFGIPYVVMEKVRPAQEKVKITQFNGDVRSKKVLIIDDMISTGGTIISASEVLHGGGAKEVSVIATHGLFTKGAIGRINKSNIKRVYVSNSIAQKKFKKLKIIDLSGFISGLIKSHK